MTTCIQTTVKEFKKDKNGKVMQGSSGEIRAEKDERQAV